MPQKPCFMDCSGLCYSLLTSNLLCYRNLWLYSIKSELKKKCCSFCETLFLLFFRYLIIIISIVLTFSGCLSYGNCSSSEAFSLTSSSCIKCDKRQVDLSMKYVKQAFHPSVIRVCLESAISNLKCLVKWNPIRSVLTVAEDQLIFIVLYTIFWN